MVLVWGWGRGGGGGGEEKGSGSEIEKGGARESKFCSVILNSHCHENISILLFVYKSFAKQFLRCAALKSICHLYSG